MNWKTISQISNWPSWAWIVVGVLFVVLFFLVWGFINEWRIKRKKSGEKTW